MNNQTGAKISIRGARFFIALLAGFFLIPAIHAQPATTNVDNRFLLIFDTSADMKKRVPMVQKALAELLATSVKGELHSGDSIGVWTFDQELQTGGFPLQHWIPEGAPMIVSNINRFVSKQHYSKSTSFDALQPLLGQVVENSERLTVIIFCDGEVEMNGTPFDSGISEVFQRKGSAQKKARQPLVVVLRSQRGEYTGCTVSFPPSAVNLPQFPPLPPPPGPKPANIPPPAAAVVPSLVIVGTKVGTNMPPPAPTNPPPVVPVSQTNAISTPLTNTAAQTNPAVASQPPPEDSGGGTKKPLVIGAVLLVAAGVLTALAAFRMRRKDRGSLITRSMREK
jgi:hypothetical protein